MKNRKIILTVVAVLCVISCALCFVACGNANIVPNGANNKNEGDGNDNPAHTTHSYVTTVVAPTCVDRGYTLYVCDCGDAYKDNYVDATGIHTFVSYNYNNDGTCIKDGTETAKCQYCDETDTRSSESHPATGVHSYADYVYNNDATCVYDGTETSTCEHCTETNTRTKAGTATGIHTFTTYIYNNDATCGRDGTATSECNVCHNAYDTHKDETHPATGDHLFSEYIYNNNATCVDDGTETAECSVCHTTDTRVKADTKTNIHKYNSQSHLCKVCDAFDPEASRTEGLSYYDYYEDNAVVGYSVSRGTANTYSFIKIPSVYNDKPVKYIEGNAFRDCKKLKRIEIPSSVTIIEEDAFRGCDRLQYNECDNGYYLGNEANPYYALIKAKNSSITSCTINDQTKIIANGAFRECADLTNIIIPDSVTHIGARVFSGCSSLSRAEISNGVKSFGTNVFYGCNSLINLSLPFVGAKKDSNSYAYLGFLFGADRYLDNSKTVPASLTTVNISSSVDIADHAFYGCDSIENVDITDGADIGESAFQNCNNLKKVLISGNVYSIGAKAFMYCHNLTDVEIRARVTNIEEYAFKDCGNLTNLTIAEGLRTIGRDAFCRCEKLTSIIIPKSVERIGAGAFSYCGLESVEINGIIGDSCFAYCNLLKNVTFNQHVTSIGGDAFQSCKSLTSIIIPDGVTTIYEYAFANCESLVLAYIPSSVYNMSYCIFNRCNDDITIYCEVGSSYSGFDIDEYWNVKEFDKVAMGGRPIPTTVKSYYSITYGIIHADGFLYGKIQDNNVYLRDIVIRDINNLSIPSVVRYRGADYTVSCISENSFRECKELTSIEIPSSITDIRGGAFAYCNKLVNITVEESNEKYSCVGNCVIEADTKTLIAGCKNSVIPIDGSVTSIGSYAFRDCSSLTSIEIPNSVTSIGSSAFSGCSGLTSITIPDSVTSIGSGAFSGCSSLTIYCEAASKPSSWNSSWNSSDRPIVWGYQKQQ